MHKMRENYKILLIYTVTILAFVSIGLLLFGSLGDTQVDMSDCDCESKVYPDCNLDMMPKDYIRECWKNGPPCPLDAAKQQGTIEKKQLRKENLHENLEK